MANATEWLYDDVQKNLEDIKTNNTPLSRRNFLRSLFAYYEGSLSNLREITLKILIDNFYLSGKWELHQLYPLFDESARLTGNGKLELDPSRYPFQQLVAYTLKTYSDLVDFDGQILSEHGWEDFCASIRIRNRITHPKDSTEIDLTNDELKIIDDGRIWWISTIKKLNIAYCVKFIK